MHTPTLIAASAGGSIFALLVLAWAIVLIIAGWIIFTKAGEAGWKVLIPFYNYYVVLRIVGRPGWWLILYFIPIVNWVIGIIVALDLAKSFGRGVGFGLGLAFLGFIFAPILAFGSATYVGPAAQS
jgi:hypothetical protein